MVSCALIDPYLDSDSAVECEDDGASVNVTDSVSASIVQTQDFDFATTEEGNSEFFFGNFGQDSESAMVQMIPIETIKPSIELPKTFSFPLAL
ncbi:hypothetical protein QL285_031262 [Trifolium repens]|nr:hypothetical protein QL285_031262 [Trifolium repens]